MANLPSNSCFGAGKQIGPTEIDEIIHMYYGNKCQVLSFFTPLNRFFQNHQSKIIGFFFRWTKWNIRRCFDVCYRNYYVVFIGNIMSSNYCNSFLITVITRFDFGNEILYGAMESRGNDSLRYETSTTS